MMFDLIVGHGIRSGHGIVLSGFLCVAVISWRLFIRSGRGAAGTALLCRILWRRLGL